MDLDTARRLCDLTSTFYGEVAGSFDGTRQQDWPGWEHVGEAAGLLAGHSLRVFDLACGNLRYERHLANRGMSIDCYAVDSCDELVQRGIASLPAYEGALRVAYQHLDVLGTLLDGADLTKAIEAPACELSVSFGFLHHVPQPELRAQVLHALVAHTAPGGFVAVSFWQFAHNARLMSKALPVEGGDQGDYLLGWQGRTDVVRYCHSFSEEEVDRLVRACTPQARQVARFSADGRSGDLNRYIVLRRT